jgi:hypothetical protein
MDDQLTSNLITGFRIARPTIKPIPDAATVQCLIDDQSTTWIPETVYAFFDKETGHLIMRANTDQYACIS